MPYKHNLDFIDAINEVQRSWKAVPYPEHEKFTLQELHNRAGGAASRIPKWVFTFPTTPSRRRCQEGKKQFMPGSNLFTLALIIFIFPLNPAVLFIRFKSVLRCIYKQYQSSTNSLEEASRGVLDHLICLVTLKQTVFFWFALIALFYRLWTKLMDSKCIIQYCNMSLKWESAKWRLSQ